MSAGGVSAGLVDAIELDYVALNRDFLFTTMGQLYRRLINILSYGHVEILYITITLAPYFNNSLVVSDMFRSEMISL